MNTPLSVAASPSGDSQPDPQAKFLNTPTFLNVLTELDINRSQLDKRQAIIKKIESQLTQKYGAENRLISYVMRYGHPKAQINSSDIASLEHVLRSVSGAEQINGSIRISQ